MRRDVSAPLPAVSPGGGVVFGVGGGDQGSGSECDSTSRPWETILSVLIYKIIKCCRLAPCEHRDKQTEVVYSFILRFAGQQYFSLRIKTYSQVMKYRKKQGKIKKETRTENAQS